MLLKTEGDPLPQRKVQIRWGQEQINYLKSKKVVILRALSFDWVKQMFLMSPQSGRRLWFEVLSFSNPAPALQSLLCQCKGTDVESFYRIDFYELPSIVSYTDYVNLLNSIEEDLISAGYTVYKHGAMSEEIRMTMPNGIVGGGLISKPEALQNFRSLIQSGDYHILDETPESVFTMANKEILNLGGYDDNTKS